MAESVLSSALLSPVQDVGDEGCWENQAERRSLGTDRPVALMVPNIYYRDLAAREKQHQANDS